MKKAKWMWGLLITIFSLSVSCTKDAPKGRFVTMYSVGEDIPVEDLVIENEFLELRFLPLTTEIILTEKATGMEWRSNPLDYAGDSRSDVVTRSFMASQFALEYADVSGVGMTLFSADQSVEQGAYTYEKTGSSIKVSYAVGSLVRAYMIPPAASEEKMTVYLDQMASDERSRFLSVYRLYDIDNLRANDNRSQLLSTYPDLSQRKLYILRGDSQEHQKEFAEETLGKYGYTYAEFMEDMASYPSAGGAERPAFNVSLNYSLDGKSLVVDVPFDDINYRGSYPILQLSILPYMGAGGLDDEGYLLVPDGSGALIIFNNSRHSQITYNVAVYGWDEGMPRDAVVNDDRAPFAAFGIEKNGSALLCVIEEGDAYASVLADVSGRRSSWNNVYSRFSMIHGAKMDISSRSERAVYLYENALPPGEKITLRYTICDEDGYVGMAKQYRKWLLNKYPSLNIPSRAESGVPVAVEILGAVNKTQHRFGMPFDLPLKLTSYKETESMINDLADFGWKNVQVKLSGWFNRSVEHAVPGRVNLINLLGSKREFMNMVSAAGKNGFDIYPEADFLYIRDIKPFDGFSVYSDAARYVSRDRIEKYPYSFVWFGERIRWGKLSYLARPESMLNLIDSFTGSIAPLGLNNVAFRSMGSVLSGDYNENRLVSRNAAMIMRREKMAQLAESRKLLINNGYLYAVPYAGFITDMAITDQAFAITDYSVPFYQIAVHGLVPYTGRAINLAEDYTKHLLQTIESGAGLYFSFMTEETAVLQETKFRQFYANEYGKWVNDADALYRRFNADFAGLYAQAITDHRILGPGVTVTVYEDGTMVVVNAGETAWSFEYADNLSLAVEVNNYVVVRGN